MVYKLDYNLMICIDNFEVNIKNVVSFWVNKNTHNKYNKMQVELF